MNFPDKQLPSEFSDKNGRKKECVNPTGRVVPECACEIFDAAVVLLLHREEYLLRDVVEQSNKLVQEVSQQAHELEAYLDEQF